MQLIQKALVLDPKKSESACLSWYCLFWDGWLC
jgi:hypothetical protein